MTIGLGFLPATVFAFMLVFARVGTMMMLVPAFGEQAILSRLRLGLALILSLIFLPLVRDLLPAAPDDLMTGIVYMGHEIAVGLILGGLARMVVSIAQVAGATIAFQMGLSVAQTADPSQPGVQGAVVGSFLSMLGITMIFATDMHYMVLAGIFHSYQLFPPDAPLMFGDASKLAISVVGQAFAVGVQIAAPFIVFGLVFYLGLGLLSKLMPQLQVFFIAMPANIGIGLVLLAAVLAMSMVWYLQHFQTEIARLLG